MENTSEQKKLISSIIISAYLLLICFIMLTQK